MRFNDIKLKTRINLALGVLISAVLCLLGVVIFSSQKSSIVDEAEERMLTHVDDLYNLLESQVKSKQESVSLTARLAHEVFYESGTLRIQNKYIDIGDRGTRRGTSGKSLVKRWTINGEQVQLNNKLIDRMLGDADQTVTIFQKVDEGYVRIATNLQNEGGMSGIGTIMPKFSTIAKTIESGKVYQGRSKVMDNWYITRHEPIWHQNEIVGILSVGVRELDFAQVSKIFKSKSYFKRGYPFLVESSGVTIIHPKTQGIDLKNTSFFKLMIKANKSDYNRRYLWPDNAKGEWKQLFFRYFEPYDAYLCVTLYEKDLYAGVHKLLVLVLCGVACSLLLTFTGVALLLKPVTSGIGEIAILSKKISDGDLEASIKIYGKDELGQTADSLRNMVDKLKSIVHTILKGAANISGGSLQVSTASQELSQGANEHASSIEEISSTMEQITSNASQNSENAQETEKIATEASSGIEEVNKNQKDAIAANQKISERISVINDIAFQTNILALNAAVEAARAGEHGKGFAVVASEVRKLAEKSKLAADEIVKIADDSLKLAEIAGEKLSTLLPEVENTANLVREISAASLEQSTGAEQVNQAIQQLNVVSQQNAAASEELATNSEEMNSQADQLEEVISYFHIDGTDTHRGKLKSKPRKKIDPGTEQLPTSKETGVDLVVNEEETY